MEVKIDYSYFDLDDKPCELTVDEVGFFDYTVSIVKKALSVDIPIYPCNHEREYKGNKSKNALGIFYTSDPDNPKKDCFITIDNFFIHECYEEMYHGAFNLNFQSLEEVICHEIAHSEKFRHCKTHERITNELLKRVQQYMKSQEISIKVISGGLDEKIIAAKMSDRKKRGEKGKVSVKEQGR